MKVYTVKTHLTKIGNSRGIRIPKNVIEECGLTGEIEMKIEKGKLILSAASNPRRSWDASFSKIAEEGNDYLLIEDDFPSKWDGDEWTW